MKNITSFRFASTPGDKPNRPRGFALIITITLMVLLSLLAVGLLGLSTIALRSSSSGDAMQEARANARLGLVMALGQLQKQVGDDRRVTAPARLNDSSAPRHVTGVWEGVEFTSQNPTIERSERCLGYLASGIEDDPTTLPPSDGISLIAEGSLGSAISADDRVAAAPVAISGSDRRTRGRYAWAALDESTKAKLDLVREESLDFGNAEQVRVGAASRFGIENISGLEEHDWFGSSEHGRAISLNSAELVESVPDLGPFQHDVTTASYGLLTDPARGGLKRDLSRMIDNLPADFSGARLYTDEAVAEAENNPYWSHIAHYGSLYKDLGAGAGGYGITARLPPGGSPALNRRERSFTNPQTPEETPLMPVVARVQMQFTLVSKDAHGHWGGGTIRSTTDDPRRTLMLYMIYTPIVTLYNPYNVELEIPSIRVELEDIPIGFRFFRNGQPQTSALAHFNQLYVFHDTDSRQAKSFGLNLQASRSGGSTPIVLAPGEARIFGESASGNSSFTGGDRLFDWQDDDLTANVTLTPGYARGMGFWVDWLTPPGMATEADDGMGIMSLRSTDQVDVEFAPMPSDASGNKFTISLYDTASPGPRDTPMGVFEMNYVNARTLEGSLTGEQSDAFPRRLQRPLRASEIYQSPSDPIRNFRRARPFAIFGFEAKSTLTSQTPGKPWVQGGLSGNMSVINLRTEKMDHHPREMSMKAWEPDQAIEHDPLTNRAYFFTSGTALAGLNSAPQYEIPSLPLQSLAQLRHAQLAPQGFLGGATYTVGESFASPLIPQQQLTSETRSSYDIIDHSWLANSSLWDAYFLSTIAEQGGRAMGSSKSAEQVARAFFNREEDLLNPRLTPLAAADPQETAESITANDGYLQSAKHLMIDGPFNVNSLSLPAWKALLSSLNQESVEFFDGTGGARGQGDSGVVADASNPFTRMRRATGEAVEEQVGGLDARRARWHGFRSLNDEQIDQLAREIVAEIETRGPFRSLADFVNRRPGGEVEQALAGTIQAAIDRTSLNDDFRNDSVIYEPADLADSEFEFPEAMLGQNAVGAPGYLTQGDILSAVGPVLTVRADTFRVRAYGESVDGSGRVSARAWCEAVVQRTPDYLDPADEPESSPDSEVNQTFGRRFQVVSFRWLSQDEV